MHALPRRAVPAASPSSSCPRPGWASPLFRITHSSSPAILLELEGEKSRIGDGDLNLLLLLWIHSPSTGGDFCWVPSSSDSIHFAACDPCTLFFGIACPPPSALCLSGLFRFGPSPGIPFLGAASAHLCRQPLLSSVSSRENIPPLPPFLSTNTRLTSQMFLGKAAGSSIRAALVCQDPWPMFPG